jgi:hypothetical protein
LQDVFLQCSKTVICSINQWFLNVFCFGKVNLAHGLRYRHHAVGPIILPALFPQACPCGLCAAWHGPMANRGISAVNASQGLQ